MSTGQWKTREERRIDAAAKYHEVMTHAGPGPDYAYYDAGVIGFVFGEMWSRPGLTRKERRWVTLSCVAAADATIPIQTHVYAALNSGDCTLEELDEFNLHFATQLGWPKGQNVNMYIIEAAARVASERGDPERKPSIVLWDEPTDPEARYRRGRVAFEDIMRTPSRDQETPFRTLAYLSYLYGEIWTRPVLSSKERRLISICCAAASNAERELDAHLDAALKSGDLRNSELDEVVLHFAVYCGWLPASKLDDALTAALERADSMEP